MSSAARQAAIKNAAAMMIMMIFPREDGSDALCAVLPGPAGEVAALVRAGDDMNLGLRNACEMLET